MAKLASQPESYWKQKLTDEQYQVMRKRGTEAPFSGQLVKNKQDGMYHCAACGAELFSSKAKFESQTPGLMGWPSFDEPANTSNIELKPDNTLGMKRTEVICKHCGGHLGHLFEADDAKTGQHYCINSCALDFKSKQP